MLAPRDLARLAVQPSRSEAQEVWLYVMRFDLLLLCPDDVWITSFPLEEYVQTKGVIDFIKYERIRYCLCGALIEVVK